MKRTLAAVAVITPLLALALGEGSAAASNYCMHGGKRYTVHATRCTGGKQYRCVAHMKWKYLRACKARGKASGPRFCTFGGKRYTVHATRCTNGKQYRCVAHQTWRFLRACRR